MTCFNTSPGGRHVGKRRVLIFVESGIWLLVAYFEIPGTIVYNRTGFWLSFVLFFQSVFVTIEIDINKNELV